MGAKSKRQSGALHRRPWAGAFCLGAPSVWFCCYVTWFPRRWFEAMWNVFLLLFCFTFLCKAINGDRLWGNKCIAQCVLEKAVAACHVTWSNYRLFFILCYGSIWSAISISQDWDSFVILCKDPGPARGEGGGRAPDTVLRHWANVPQTRNPFENLSVPVGFSESHVSCTPGCSGLQPSPVTGNPCLESPQRSRKRGLPVYAILHWGVAEQRKIMLLRGWALGFGSRGSSAHSG